MWQRSRYLCLSLLSSVVVVSSLVLIVLLVNSPLIRLNFMYEEQPLLYVVNQQIHSWRDLFTTYLHPLVLESLTIPFFRPSGHFLVYQVLTQFVDWHNTRAFLVTNFVFLALSCYMIVQLYRILFKSFQLGAYIACGIYLLHPALSLSRLTPMHFEFASVFFVLAGLYYFILFCQTQCQSHRLLLASLGCYAISVTFKETSLMLGPVMALYLLTHFNLPHRQPVLRQLVIILVAVTATLATYLSFEWPSLTNPFMHAEATLTPVNALLQLGRIVFGYLDNPMYPPLVQPYLHSLLFCLLLGSLFISFTSTLSTEIKKSFLFLLLASLAFLIMPVVWGRARPWHVALSLVFISQAIGYCIEYACYYGLRNRIILSWVGSLIVLACLISAFFVAYSNALYFSSGNSGVLAAINRNAVLHAPSIRSRLNHDSIIVTEDRFLHDAYLLGNASYPIEPFQRLDLTMQHLQMVNAFYKFPQVYGGTLFKWAYLMPSLKEEVYDFQVEHMERVTSITLYNWLQHAKNIFCLGYDDAGNWHDRTF